jgi:hypothetical protein
MDDFKNRPGSALEHIIPHWVVAKGGGCGCKDYAKKMNIWGTEGCKQRRQDIVSHLLGQEEVLMPILKLIPNIGKEVIARSLVDRAIRMSE